MSRVVNNSTATDDEASITMCGEIDDAGMDALAELLIAAAKRRHASDHDTTSDGQEETEHDRLEAS